MKSIKSKKIVGTAFIPEKKKCMYLLKVNNVVGDDLTIPTARKYAASIANSRWPGYAADYVAVALIRVSVI